MKLFQSRVERSRLKILDRSDRKKLEETADQAHLRIRGLKDFQLYPLDLETLVDVISQAPPYPQYQRLSLSTKTPIATLGSCFVRFFKEQLVSRGFNHVQTEFDAFSRHSSCGWERVYTSANIYQILKDIESQKVSVNRFFKDGDRVRDLFRHKVSFSNLEEAFACTQNHIRLGMEAIKQAEVLFLTLGQNETWYDEFGDYWFGQLPPVELTAKKQQVKVVQLTTEMNKKFLNSSYVILKTINPKIKVILNIAPIPAIGTFFNENVITRSFLNKAILRVSINEFMEKMPPEVLYFPAFELSHLVPYFPFQSDNRHPNPRFMTNLMDLFFRLYIDA
jgi:hypothetical protein